MTASIYKNTSPDKSVWLRNDGKTVFLVKRQGKQKGQKHILLKPLFLNSACSLLWMVARGSHEQWTPKCYTRLCALQPHLDYSPTAYNRPKLSLTLSLNPSGIESLRARPFSTVGSTDQRVKRKSSCADWNIKSGLQTKRYQCLQRAKGLILAFDVVVWGFLDPIFLNHNFFMLSTITENDWEQKHSDLRA